MNVIILGSPLETAKKLDKKRLNKQINECTIILRALRGEYKAWTNHPCTLQYKGHFGWLANYRHCLMNYRDFLTSTDEAEKLASFIGCDCFNNDALGHTPNFHTSEFVDQMKRLLYTKDKQHYVEFAELGESNQKWFFVGGVMRVYENGKRIK